MLEMPKNKWIYDKEKRIEIRKEAEEIKVNTEIYELLKSRGMDISTEEQFNNFLTEDDEVLKKQLLDERTLPDMDKFVDILKDYKDKEVVFYSDFDVDGVTGASVAVCLSRDIGIKAHYYTNNRFTGGYGLNKQGIDEIIEKYPEAELIITIDNGIVAFEGIEYAYEKGLKVIITDHHEQSNELPKCEAVINPKRRDSEYPFSGICGATVIFKCMMALYKELGVDIDKAFEYIEFIALGTVADIVPLLSENRAIVKLGLKKMNSNPRQPFRILKEVTSTIEVNSMTLGFLFGPIINAIGRIEGQVQTAIEAFITDDEDYSREVLSNMTKINEERKELTKIQFEEAEKKLEEKGLKKVIVIENEDFHAGIVGLIAGKLKEKYNRPVFIFSYDKLKGVFKGSGRSTDKFSLFDNMERMKEVYPDIIHQGGGHDKAAGLTVYKDKIREFEDKMNEFADETLTEEDFVKDEFIDMVIDKPSEELFYLINKLEPFGEAFPKPNVAINSVEILNSFAMGKDKNHLKVNGSKGEVIIGWNLREEYERRIKGANERNLLLYALGSINLNEYNGATTPQFIIKGNNLKFKNKK